MSQVSQKYICLNSSSADKIRGVIPEIGKKLSKRIVRRRKTHPFRTWDDLKKVTRIGDGIVKKLKAQHYLFLHYPPTQATEEMEELSRNHGKDEKDKSEPQYNIGDLVRLANSHGDWGGWLALRARVVGIRAEYPGFYDLEFEEGVTGIYSDFDIEPYESPQIESPYYMQNITNQIGDIYFSKVINVKNLDEDAHQIRKDLDYEGTTIFDDFPFVGRITSRALVHEHPKLKELKIAYANGEVNLSNFAQSISAPGSSSTATLVGKNHDHILTASHHLSYSQSVQQVINNFRKKLSKLEERKRLMPLREAQRIFLKRAIEALGDDGSKIQTEHVFFPQFHCDLPSSKFKSVTAIPVIVGNFKLEGVPFTYAELLEGPTIDAKYRRGNDYALLKLSKRVDLESTAFPLATIMGDEREIEQALTELSCFGYPSGKFEYRLTKSVAPMIYDEQHCLGTRTAFSSQSDHIQSPKSKGLRLGHGPSYIQVRGLDASEGSSGAQLFMKHEGRLFGIGILGGPCFSQPLPSNPNFAFEDTAFCPYRNEMLRAFEKAGLDVETKSFRASDLINKPRQQSVGLKRSLEELKSYNPDSKKRKRKRNQAEQ